MLPRLLRPLGQYFGYYYHLIMPLEFESSAFELYSSHIISSDVVLEVGARTGAATRVLSGLCRKVYSFEPNPYSFRILKHNFRNSRNVILFNMALSDKKQNSLLHIGNDASLTTPSDSLKKIIGTEYQRTITVVTTTIDDIDWDPVPTCFVLDCEGSEVEVLAGGQKTICSGSVKKLLVETHTLQDNSNTESKVRQKLLDYGFQTSSYSDSASIPWIIASKVRTS